MVEVINLATLEKQNQILSNFPILDWANKTPIYTVMQVTGDFDYHTVVEVTGNGVAMVALKSSDGSWRDSGAKLTVDGVVLDETSDINFTPPNSAPSRVYGVGGLNFGSANYKIGNWGMIDFLNSQTAPITTVAWIGFKNSFKFEIKLCGVISSFVIYGGAVVIA